jgi:tRNA 2-thiouridine synthesizing protein A
MPGLHPVTFVKDMTHFDVEIDTSGLNCPMPLLKTKKALATMESGQVLHVISTDPASVIDIAAFAAKSGNILQGSRQEGGNYYYLLRKG